MHFPLCVVKCTYCDFYSVPGGDHDPDAVLSLLVEDVERIAPESPRTVFLGGGTPSFHSAEGLSRFLDRLDACSGFRASAVEVTVECNPESLDRAKAQALREGGATRVSIGVQSLRPAILESFGRAHSVDQSFAAVEAARAAGFERISTDMIYAVPGQAPEEWVEDLEQVLSLGLEHLSAYNLTFEPGTALERQRRFGEVVPADEGVELEMFWATRRLAAAAGLEAYEISNFARPERTCEHNLRYWRGQDYVGVGPSAVSRVGDLRWGNVRNLERWRQAVSDRDGMTAWVEQSGPRQRLAEAWWLGLRLTEGVDPDRALGSSSWDEVDDPARRIADELVATGHIEQVGGRYRLTESGLPLADAVARRFIRWADAKDS